MEIDLITEQDPSDPSRLQLYGEAPIQALLARLNQLKHSRESDFYAVAVAFITKPFDPLGDPGQACSMRIWNARYRGHKGKAAASDSDADSRVIAFSLKQRRASQRKGECLIYVRQDHVEKARVRRVVQALVEQAQQRGSALDRVGIVIHRPGKVWRVSLAQPR